MLQEDKINVEEAMRLLEATEANASIRRPQISVAHTNTLEGEIADEAIIAARTTHTHSSSSAFLAGARLGGAKLDGAKLDGAFLLGADLRDADLRDANFNGAFLPFANGSDGDMAGANWPGAFMPFTRFHQRKVQTV